MVKISSFRNGSQNHILDTKTYLRELGLVVGMRDIEDPMEWPAVQPDYPKSVQFLNGMGYRNPTMSTTNPFEFLYDLYHQVEKTHHNLQELSPAIFMKTLVDKI